MHRKRPLILLLTILMSLSLLFIYLHQFAGHPSYYLANAMNLKSISMDSSSDGWAVGEISGKPNHVLFHYHTGQWTIVKPLAEGTVLMPGIHTTLQSVSMISSTEGWAIGNTSIPQGKPIREGQTTSMSVQPAGVLLHYLNGNWIAVTIYAWADLLQISMQSATLGWLLGQSQNTGETMILHYSGQQWMNMHLPGALAHASITALSILDAHTVWAAGDYGSVFRYDGTTWTQLPKACDECRINALDLVSPNEGWAIGSRYNSSQGIILHYQYGKWTLQSGTTTPGLLSISMLSPTDGWATGGNGQIFRYAHEHWTQVDSPTNQELSQISMLSSTDGWAVGRLGTILHYQDGSWNLFTNIVYQQEAWDIYSKG